MQHLPTEILLIIGEYCDSFSVICLHQTCAALNNIFIAQCWAKLQICLAKKTREFVSQDCIQITPQNVDRFIHAVQQGWLDPVFPYVQELFINDTNLAYNGGAASRLFTELIGVNFRNIRVQAQRSLFASFNKFGEEPTELEQFIRNVNPSKLQVEVKLTDNKAKFPKHDTILFNNIQGLDYRIGPRPRSKSLPHLAPFPGQALPPNLKSARLFLPGLVAAPSADLTALQTSNLIQLELTIPVHMKQRNCLNWIPDSVCILTLCTKHGTSNSYTTSRQPRVIRRLEKVKTLTLELLSPADSIASLRLPNVTSLSTIGCVKSPRIDSQVRACLSHA